MTAAIYSAWHAVLSQQPVKMKMFEHQQKNTLDINIYEIEPYKNYKLSS